MTYKPDFTSCRAKLRRAEEHLDIFQSEAVASFAVESNRAGLSIEFDAKSGYHIYRVATLPPEDLLLRFGLIIGDVVHNLRGALDHLAWQISLFGGNGKSTGTDRYCPTCRRSCVGGRGHPQRPLIDTSKLNTEISRAKFFPLTLQLDVQVAGYFAPTIAFRDPVADTKVISARSTLALIAREVRKVIREFEAHF
jgi:hypothetical protein